MQNIVNRITVKIPIDLLELDPLNPRLPEKLQGANQTELTKILYEQFEIADLTHSMAENGYFDEEPIVVIVKRGIAEKEIQKLETHPELFKKSIESLIQEKKIKFIVVEGNRRTSTVKILTNEDLRRRIGVNDKLIAFPNDEIQNHLQSIPAVVYKNRKEVFPYLGVKHISGILKWETYAKATYLAKRIEEETKESGSVNQSIQNIRKQIGETTDVIKKQYLGYLLVKQAEQFVNIPSELIKNKFSSIVVIINSPKVRSYFGLKPYNEANLDEFPVETEELENFTNVLSFVFGDHENKAVLMDPKHISRYLGSVLTNEKATTHLIKTRNLEEAYEMSGSEGEFLIKRLETAQKGIKKVRELAQKYNSEELKLVVEECIRDLNLLREELND